jgi:hypothetical protein
VASRQAAQQGSNLVVIAHSRAGASIAVGGAVKRIRAAGAASDHRLSRRSCCDAVAKKPPL